MELLRLGGPNCWRFLVDRHARLPDVSMGLRPRGQPGWLCQIDGPELRLSDINHLRLADILIAIQSGCAIKVQTDRADRLTGVC